VYGGDSEHAAPPLVGVNRKSSSSSWSTSSSREGEGEKEVAASVGTGSASPPSLGHDLRRARTTARAPLIPPT
jgi:hypothetical protein